jgi:Gpi18-like mannosyltransferase
MERATTAFKSRVQQWTVWLEGHDVALAVVITLCLIVGGLGLGWYSNRTIPLNPGASAHYLGEPSNPLTFMSDWDGPIYILISQHGYDIGNNQFFPAYPMLVHAATYIVRSPLVSALLVSWICLAGACFFYLQLVKLLWPRTRNQDALLGLLLFVLFPTGIFLLATYPESLLALAALGAMTTAMRKQWWQSGLWLALATATHPDGVFLLPLVGLMLKRQQVDLRRIIAGLAIGCAGIVSYMAYLWVRFGNPLQFTVGHRHNGWLHFSSYFHSLFASVTALALLTYVLLIITAVYWWQRRREFSLYTILYLLLPLGGGIFGGYARYALIVFPAQFMLFEKTRKRSLAYPIVIAVSAILWTFFFIHYAGGYTGGD